jgi:hypothetical protein
MFSAIIKPEGHEYGVVLRVDKSKRPRLAL